MKDECEAMSLSFFIALGAFLLLAARKPSLHRSLITFAAWQAGNSWSPTSRTSAEGRQQALDTIPRDYFSFTTGSGRSSAVAMASHGGERRVNATQVHDVATLMRIAKMYQFDVLLVAVTLKLGLMSPGSST